MDREQMVERIVTVMLSEYIEEDLTPRAWDYMLAEKVLDAILPQITTVEELEALPFETVLVSAGGTVITRKSGRLARENLAVAAAVALLPLTVVWRP